MSKRPTFDTFKHKLLQDEETKMAYDLLESEFAVMKEFIKARKKVRCSQMELANRLNIQQPAIARLEKGGYTTTSVGKLVKVADALGYSLKISLSPKKKMLCGVAKKNSKKSK